MILEEVKARREAYYKKLYRKHMAKKVGKVVAVTLCGLVVLKSLSKRV